MYANPWLYNGKIFTEEDIDTYVGFVYLVTNLTNGKMYVGKKNFRKSRRIVRKTKRTRRVISNSDWETYYGSNEYLSTDVSGFGIENFKREIIRLCRSKGEMSYYEVKEQLERDVLLREDYYNNFVGCKIHRKHLTTKT